MLIYYCIHAYCHYVCRAVLIIMMKGAGIKMTIRECYEKLHGDYEDVISRLGSDSLTERFILKFLNDKTFDTLKQAVDDGDVSASFKAAHTLKGVAANLSFTALFETTGRLTEQLRSQSEPADKELMNDVSECYQTVISVINEYASQK